MIRHLRARLNTVQNAVDYMMKPTIGHIFSGPGGAGPAATIISQTRSVMRFVVTRVFGRVN